MGHRAAFKPRPLKRHRDERRASANAAIQRATFNHQMALVDDPDHPGHTIPYCQLEQRLRARTYQLAMTRSR